MNVMAICSLLCAALIVQVRYVHEQIKINEIAQRSGHAYLKYSKQTLLIIAFDRVSVIYLINNARPHVVNILRSSIVDVTFFFYYCFLIQTRSEIGTCGTYRVLRDIFFFIDIPSLEIGIITIFFCIVIILLRNVLFHLFASVIFIFIFNHQSQYLLACICTCIININIIVSTRVE